MKPENARVESRVIFFSDLHNFSQIDRDLRERSVDFIQDFYATVGEIIVENRGEIIKYMGDSVFALFPCNSENRVVQAAVEMRRAYRNLLEQYQVDTESELEIGIGSGEVTVGTFGHPTLRVKDAFGVAICDTAVMMHHRGIAITQAVHEKIEARVPTKRLPDLQVKWRETPLTRWEIIEQPE